MRITIAAIGSTGDVWPYLGLGAHLATHGHIVTIATHGSYAHEVADLDLTHFTVPTEPGELLTPDLVRALRRGGRRAAKAVAEAFRPFAWEMAAAVDVACGKADLALLSPLAWFGRNSAEGYGIPSMGLHLQPLEPTRAFPPATIAARSLGGPLNRALGRKLQAMMVDPHLGIVNDLRALHGLKPTTVAAHADASRNWPVLHGFSEHVVPRPDDWPAEKSVTGYWWPPTPKNWTPDPVLLDFLESGPRPVFVGFGSTSPMDPEALSQLVERVTERMRLRAVVQSGWAELSSSAAHVLTVGSVPHEWLFPRMRALVHHAGAGTTAAAVRAGVPSVPVPMALDQPFWAHRLHRAGIAARPVPARRLTAGALERSLTEVVGGQRLADAASRLASLVATDDGAETARRLIEQYRA